MTEQETQAILTVSLMAAFADGRKDETERAEIRRIAENLAPESGLNLSALVQDVLLARRTVEDAAAQLQSPQARQLAYEMAVCTCDADGSASQAEKAFLARLGAALQLEASESATVLSRVEAVAAAPALPEVIAHPSVPDTVPAAHAAADARKAGAGETAGASAVDDGATDKTILNYAILNGALELLPESVATMAIIPLQMKMVYQIGQRHGYELDRGHIKDLLATLGVGLTGQYLEQIGRKLLGGLLKKAGGGLLGSVGKAGVSVGMSFATTYALGQVAKRYYAGGRTLDTASLKQSFAAMMDDGKRMYERHAGAIQHKASTLDTRQIANLVRGA